MTIIFLGLLAYLIGSIPCGVLVAKTQNINIREHGSGNIGATNIARTLGKKEGIITLLGDSIKGVLALWLSSFFLNDPSKLALIGFMAFLGHLFSVFLKFRGGKGVATGLGIFLYLTPLAAFGAISVFAITLSICRYVSLGSILGALTLPAIGIILGTPESYIITGFGVATLIIIKHRENISRLLAGTESKFGKKSQKN
jgi:acyl phosphate:glycerol-3-phosphate acyltransferase